jgi:hypothetical protein
MPLREEFLIVTILALRLMCVCVCIHFSLFSLWMRFFSLVSSQIYLLELECERDTNALKHTHTLQRERERERVRARTRRATLLFCFFLSLFPSADTSTKRFN